MDAQDRADSKLRRPKTAKLVADPELAAHITQRLKAKDSPMTISIELARNVHGIEASVSHECICQAVYAHGKRGLAKGCMRVFTGGVVAVNTAMTSPNRHLGR